MKKTDYINLILAGIGALTGILALIVSYATYFHQYGQDLLFGLAVLFFTSLILGLIYHNYSSRKQNALLKINNKAMGTLLQPKVNKAFQQASQTAKVLSGNNPNRYEIFLKFLLNRLI